MFLVQELQHCWALREREFTWDEMTALAAQAPAFQAFIEPDSVDFMLPGDMPGKIQRACQRSGQIVPHTQGEILRVVFKSLACKYHYINQQFNRLMGQEINAMHIIGGGSRNALLNQFIANIMKVPVITGPAEATTVGNMLVQMISLGLLSSVNDARELVQRSFSIQTYLPEDSACWEDAYQRFLRVTALTD